MPRFVATAMSGKTPSLLAPDPVTYTRAAVATIGIQNNTYGYLYHSLEVHLSNNYDVPMNDNDYNIFYLDYIYRLQ